MRWESLAFGCVALVLGIYLVSTHSEFAGVNLPGLIGPPFGGSSSVSNPECTGGFGGLGIGTIVALFGLGMIANGIRPPPAANTGAMMAPQMAATLRAAALAQRPAVVPPIRICPACASANSTEAVYCQKCGRPLPAHPPPPPAAAPPPTP